MKRASATAAAVLAAHVCAPASGHHSTSAFDTETELAVEGVLIRYEWANPHVYLWLEERTEAGETTVWEVEGSPPAFLARQGLTEDALPVGARVTINGHPSRDAARRAMLMDTLTTDGAVVTLGQEGAIFAIAQENATVDRRADGLAGTWGTTFDFAAVQRFLDPSMLQLTEAGRAALEQRRAQGEPQLGCAPGPAPGVMLAPDIKVIDVRDDVVLLRRGWDDVVRTVHLNPDSRAGAVPSDQGHSIGRWEGRALVVETTHFTPHPSGNVFLLRSGPQKRLLERLELDDGGRYLTYSFELHDPEYLAEPVVSDGIRWAFRPDLEYAPVPCDVDNARRSLPIGPSAR